MGFFSSIRDAATEANEDVHGQRLLSHVMSTLQTFESLDQRVLAAISLGYLQIRDRLNVEVVNWTRDGRIRIARQMQDQAREALDTDVAGAYAKWLAGAWLESGERRSQKAQVALNTLNMYESELRRTLNCHYNDDSGTISTAVSISAGSHRPLTQIQNEPSRPQDRGNAGYYPVRQPNLTDGERVFSSTKQYLERKMAMPTNVGITCPHCKSVTTGPISSQTTVMNVSCRHCGRTFLWRCNLN